MTPDEEIGNLRLRLAEAEQQADSGFLRSVLAASADCIKVLDLDAKLIFMSEGGKNVMEVSDFNTIRGCDWTDFWQGETSEAAFAAVAAARAGGTGHFQGMANTMAGTPRWWDVQVTPIPGADGKPEKLLSVSRDITASRAEQAALAEAQALNTLILQSSRDCIVVLDLDAHTLLVSAGGIEAMEIADVRKVIGLSWLRVWEGAALVAAQNAVAAARAGGTGRFQGYCPTHTGTPKWWDVVISPLPGSDGKPARLVSVGRDMTELKQAEQLLSRSDERLRLALGATRAVGVWERDVASDILIGDANLARIFGVDPALAARGAPASAFTKYLHPDDVAARDAELERLRNGKQEYLAEYRVCQPGLPVRWVLARGQIVPAAAGIPSRFTGAVLDITDRKQAEIRANGLLELGDRLRDLHDISGISLVAASIVGRTFDIIRAGYGTVDAAREAITIDPDWTADGIASLVGTHRFADFGSYIADLQRGETVVVHDTAADPRTRDMAAAWQSIGVGSLINVPVFENGRFVAVFLVQRSAACHWSMEEIAFVQNAADRTRAEIERRRAEQQLRDLAASLEKQVAERTADRNRMWQLSTNIMLVAGFDGVIMAVNPAWTTILGWTEQELLGRSLFDLTHPDDVDRTSQGAANMANGETLLRFDNRYRHRDGSYRWITWAAVPGEGLINAVGRDVTAEREQAEALRQAEDRLRQSQKMEAVGQLTGGLAHDFNNLLTGISGSLELLGSRLREGRIHDLDRYIVAAQGAAKRAASLTHRLLAFSRQQTLDPKPTNVNRLVMDMAELIRRTMGPEIETEVVGAADLWPALVDANQLENALLNLCINARDAMARGGRLTIETANKWLDAQAAAFCELPQGQYISLSVTDTGTGMSPEIAKRAFDPFFTTKPIGEGTGLGLSMIHGFARQSGGQIRIYTELGHGTTMALYLPRHTGEVTAVAASDPTPVPRAGDADTVLIVDDEPTVRMLVAEVLEDLGYRSMTAGDSTAALRVLQSDARIDLLVSDVGLPGGMNGRQVADAARLLRPELKVLFITGYAQNAAVGNGHLEAGMHVLTKPFAVETLARRIQDVLRD